MKTQFEFFIRNYILGSLICFCCPLEVVAQTPATSAYSYNPEDAPTPFPITTTTTTSPFPTTTIRTTTTTSIPSPTTTVTTTTITTTTAPAPCISPQCHRELSQISSCECCPDGSIWDGSKCTVQCSLWSININYGGETGDFDGTVGIHTAPAAYSAVSEWFRNAITMANSLCSARSGVFVNAIDDCVAYYFLAPDFSYTFLGDMGNPYWPALTGVEALNWTPQKNLQSKSYKKAMPGWFTRNIAGTFILDANHQLVSDIPESVDACDAGTYTWYWQQSPISLLWSDNVDIDSDATVTNFPLNPTVTDKWYIWKASGKAPLLVYDPEHTGKITSGEQLFGNWTFGGKKLASLVGSEMQGASTAQWKDGYEALASLDLNNDHKISANELEPLALWFDYNQDSIVDKGEVKRLQQVGVTALYYKADRVEQATNNIFATLGYERITNGKRIVGSSVDWHSYSADSKQELINKHLAYAKLCQTEKIFQQTSTVKTEGAKNSQLLAYPKAKAEPKSELSQNQKGLSKTNLSGIWIWASNDAKFKDPNFSPQGFLGFNDNGDSTITGHTYSEMRFNQNSKDAKYMLNISNFTGKKTTGSDNKTRLTFSLDASDGTHISSKATLSDDGLQLTGESTATVKYSGKPVTITYTWYALRKNMVTVHESY